MSILGSWHNAANSSEHVELRADGQFSLDEYGQHHEGTWELEGKILLLHISPTFTGMAEWDGHAFVDNEQKHWVRTAAAAAEAAANPDALTNEDVIRMVVAQVATSKIIHMIQTQPGNYSFTPESMAQLRQQEVPDEVIAAMKARASASSAAPASTPTATQQAKAPAVSSGPPCPSKYGTYYWDGASWQAMSQLLAEGSSASVRPIPFATNVKSVARYRYPAAPITLGPSPRFCISGGSQLPRNLVIAALDVKSDHREIQVMQAGSFSGAKAGIPDKKLEPITIKQVSDSVIEFSITRPLPAGQYMIFPTGQGYLGYDFGVRVGAP